MPENDALHVPERPMSSLTQRDAYRIMLREYPDVMDIEQMSAALGICTKTGYQLLRTGRIVGIKVGRAYRIPKAHILTYLRIGV